MFQTRMNTRKIDVQIPFIRSKYIFPPVEIICVRRVRYSEVYEYFAAQISGLKISISGLKISISSHKISIYGLKILISSHKISISGLKISISGLKKSISSLKGPKGPKPNNLQCNFFQFLMTANGFSWHGGLSVYKCVLWMKKILTFSAFPTDNSYFSKLIP